MSDRREAQGKPLIILQNAENNSTWKSYTISRLQRQSCDWAIKGRPQPNLDFLRGTLIEDDFAKTDIRLSTLVSALRDEKKDYLTGLTKSAGIIQEPVNKNLHPLLNGKTAQEVQAMLEAWFHCISPINVTQIFSDACAVKLQDCKDIIDYTSR